MAKHLIAPGSLSIFVTHPDTGRPVPRLPIYAEVAVPRIIPPRPPESRIREPLSSVVSDFAFDHSHEVRDDIESDMEQLMGQHLDKAGRDMLAGYIRTARDFITYWIEETMRLAGVNSMGDIPLDKLKEQLEAALPAAAAKFDLTLWPPDEETGIIWAEPLGVLTTDHVGYASFDLKRLRPDVQVLLAEAMEIRRSNADAPVKLAIWLHPYGVAEKFDALKQARYAFDAVVARLSIRWNTLTPALINMGMRALQNPGLTDWRLSPASFAASPKSLIGENGCEELVPASLALQEFVLRQVVRLTDKPDDINLPDGIKAAYVDEYKVSWYSLGHSLGEILYSLPLAPGETVKLAVIDWSWDSLSKRDEQTRLTEELLHQTHRDRTITETVKAGLREMQRGSSFMGGYAHSGGASGGANLGVVGLGAAAGDAWSIGGSTATSNGSRDLAAENVQRLSDSFSQASSSQREINSTVVIQARQEEKESIQTRTFSNYNHSHTLTILYYEVLRHFRVTVEWVRRRKAVLLNIPARIINFEPKLLIANRYLLENVLLDPALKGAFDVLEKREMIREFQTLHGIPTGDAPNPQWWEGDIEFSLFNFVIKTPDNEMMTPDKVVLWAIMRDGGAFALEYIYYGPHANGEHEGYDNSPQNINSGGRFNDGTGEQHIFVRPVAGQERRPHKIRWADLAGFQFEKWGNEEKWRIIKLGITGFDGGTQVSLLANPDGAAADVYHEVMGEEPSSQAVSFIRRPGPRPAGIMPARSPEKSLTQEELHLLNKLTAHLEQNREYYNRAIMLNTDPNSIAITMEGHPWIPAGTMADHVDPTPLETFGSYVAYPLARQKDEVDSTFVVDIAAALNGTDPGRRQWAADRIAELNETQHRELMKQLPLASAKSERLMTLPTRGVFAEGKLGHCNISEEIDNTRFWKWEEHPIPIQAPDINPVTPVSPEPQQVNVTPTAFPQPVVNIVNPSPAPDPGGLAAALTLLGTPNIFRDMSGKAEVADLLKKLSDNTISIAEAANKARELQAKYGTDLDKNRTDLARAQTQADAEVMKAIVQQRKEEAQQVKPNEAQDAIKLSESEMKKGNKTPDEHKEYSKQVQQNVKGAAPKKKPKENVKLQVDLKGYGNNLLIGRFGITVKQHGEDVGFLTATDYSAEGQLIVGVLNRYEDHKFDIRINGEVLGGLGVNSELRGGNVVTIPPEAFEASDYFYLTANAVTDNFEFETKKSDEVTKEVARKLGITTEAAYEKIITMKVGGEAGMEWKDGQAHTSEHTVKVKVVYYTGGFVVEYNKS